MRTPALVLWGAHIGRVRDHYCRVSEVPEHRYAACPEGSDRRKEQEGTRKGRGRGPLPARRAICGRVTQGGIVHTRSFGRSKATLDPANSVREPDVMGF